ncbi:hypothetical protein Tsubulata_013885 [Turnera subulata]|uniref:DUF4228 domain-containing protein n=1 Tax=Turnera subulata TaxID=218843 RepID=A0A9Q0F8W2_9ROSI|nr:hypothetical protein Tsubulata_013885 [Turnera subulata]
MGNAVSPCFLLQSSSSTSSVKLVFWEGTTRILTGRQHIAGEIMFENPEMMICHADSFFIGEPVPSLAIDDKLEPGQTYFVLPIDRFACRVLTAACLAAFSSNPERGPINFGECPFQHLRGANGTAVIKVSPEFLARLIRGGKGEEDGDDDESSSPGNSFLCSTPELKKHYEQLVRSPKQTWSPKLETISEHKSRYTPRRLIVLEQYWKQKEE